HALEISHDSSRFRLEVASRQPAPQRHAGAEADPVPARAGAPGRAGPPVRKRLETNLVSDLPGVAQFQDPHLVNPCGISESPNSPFWVSDNNAGVSTLYNALAKPAAGQPPFSINPLVVSLPTPGNPLGATGTPTGTVFNIDGGATRGFTVSGVDM